MKIISNKNVLVVLASLLVVAMGLMALYSYRIPRKTDVFEKEISDIETQSKSDNIEEIEKDVNETDFEDIDKELEFIDQELDQLQ